MQSFSYKNWISRNFSLRSFQSVFLFCICPQAPIVMKEMMLSTTLQTGHNYYRFPKCIRSLFCGRFIDFFGNIVSSLVTLRWRHNEHDYVINHQLHDCLLNRLFRRRSKKTSKLRVTGLCAGNSPMTGEFPAQRASNAENVPIWWRHHDFSKRREHITQYIVMSLKDYRVPAYFFQRICHCDTFCFDNLRYF